MTQQQQHFILVRYEYGWGTGPGSGVQAPDKIQVMAASRTRKGAERKQKHMGGTIRVASGPFRCYERNETIHTFF